MLAVFLFGVLVACVSAEGGADVVLSCALVEEGVGMGGMGGGALFTRTPATLVLRDVAVPPDQLDETLTPFVPPSVPDTDAVLLEAKVSSPEIPGGDLLLHADCNEQEVVCEISRYFPYGSQTTSEPAHFIAALHIEGGGFSVTLVLQTLVAENNQSSGKPLMQEKLGLPLSPSGSLLTEVVFLVFSSARFASAPPREDVVLNCGFRQQEMSIAQEVGVEWRLQHRGSGQRVFGMKAGLAGERDTSEVLHAERGGSSMDAALLVGEGNASLTLTKLKVSDEGTYICTVSLGRMRAQQIIQLDVAKPPHVSLSEQKLVFQAELPKILSCNCKNYYPLDVEIEWLSLSPTETEPRVLPQQGSLTSHRQNSDGTFSLSSHLSLTPSTFPPDTTVMCRVAHPALSAPISVSLVVEKPQSPSYWMFLGFLIVTVLFFYQVMS
ncbi:tapasin-related protein [Lampris incognitus]|uniref:tapasin-related protein n=1 Tax=Lampris incognitus TaxID=2546036 RepID=UPI0024B5DC15|nr:tapasin-related protein [Lampris incognitus]